LRPAITGKLTWVKICIPISSPDTAMCMVGCQAGK
jgi:hypothetical protein